ncbi:TPA: ferrous iron transport protein A [bacterium]|nr:ferrous iron transport protein A [bacterium]
MAVVSLTQMQQGKSGKIIEIQGGRDLTTRLEALGLRPGVQIEKIGSQFIRGPVMVRIGRTQVAIGFKMAGKVLVEERDE